VRVKIIRDYEEFREGQVVRVTHAKGKLLIRSGAAVITKEMVRNDLKES
jgi:hypothetical protein